jgi:hypothetical protein
MLIGGISLSWTKLAAIKVVYYLISVPTVLVLRLKLRVFGTQESTHWIIKNQNYSNDTK